MYSIAFVVSASIRARVIFLSADEEINELAGNEVSKTFLGDSHKLL